MIILRYQQKHKEALVITCQDKLIFRIRIYSYILFYSHAIIHQHIVLFVFNAKVLLQDYRFGIKSPFLWNKFTFLHFRHSYRLKTPNHFVLPSGAFFFNSVFVMLLYCFCCCFMCILSLYTYIYACFVLVFLYCFSLALLGSTVAGLAFCATLVI